MSKIWFSSDLHLGHHNIIEFCDRPYKSVERMEEAFVNNFNSKVNPRDTTYFIGDIVMGNKQLTLKSLNKFNGKKILIVGNHDNVFDTTSTKAQKNWNIYTKYFDEIYDTLELDGKELGIWTEKIILNHFPNKSTYIKDSSEHERRFLNHRLEDDGKSLYLHGHVHSKAKVSGERSINIGVDAWNYNPVSLDDLRHLIKEMKWHEYSLMNNLAWGIKHGFCF